MLLSESIEEKSEKEKVLHSPYHVSAGATGETQPGAWLVQNVASLGPGVCGQGGAGDG